MPEESDELRAEQVPDASEHPTANDDRSPIGSGPRDEVDWMSPTLTAGGASADPTEEGPLGLEELAAATRIAAGPRNYLPVETAPRLGAAFIDLAAQFLLIVLAYIAIGVLEYIVEPTPLGWVAELGAFLIPLTPVTIVLGYSAFEVFGTASLGKYFVEVKITRVDGSPAPLCRRVFRWFICYASLFLLCLIPVTLYFCEIAGLGANTAFVGVFVETLERAAGIWQLFLLVGFFSTLFPGRRALHDLMTGTAVYRVREIRKEPTGHAFQPILRGTGRQVLPHPPPQNF